MQRYSNLRRTERRETLINRPAASDNKFFKKFQPINVAYLFCLLFGNVLGMENVFRLTEEFRASNVLSRIG